MISSTMFVLLTFILWVIMVTSQNMESVFKNSQIIQRQNDPNIDSITNEFLVFFNLECLRNMEQSNRNIIGEFLTEFPCYSINTGVIGEIPEISDYMIVVNKDESCDETEEDKHIIWNDFCLSNVEQNERYELFADTECLSRELYPDADTLWNLNEACPSAGNMTNYVKFDESFDPEFDIMIMDSGIDSTHSEFEDIDIRTLYDASNGSELTSSHGTFVTGVLLGANTGVARINTSQIKLFDVRIGDNGTITSGNIYNGFVAIINRLLATGRKAIINLSWGSYGSGTSSKIQQISMIKSLGGIIFAAAGNDGSDASNYYPASSDDVITVGSHGQEYYSSITKTSYYRVSTFSNYGDYVDIYAPGKYIYSSKLSDTYGTSQGTSFSSPFAAGVAVNILGNNPDFGFDDILDRLYAFAEYDVLSTKTGEDTLPRVQISCDEYSSTESPTVAPTTPSPTKWTQSPTAKPSSPPTTASPSVAPTAYCAVDISSDCVAVGTGLGYKRTCNNNGYIVLRRWYGDTECTGSYDTINYLYNLDCCPTSSPTLSPTKTTNAPTPAPTKPTKSPTIITRSPTPAPTKKTTTSKPTKATNPPTPTPTTKSPSSAPTIYCAYDITGECVRVGTFMSYKRYCNDYGYVITERWLSGNTDCSGDYTTTDTPIYDLDCCPTTA